MDRLKRKKKWLWIIGGLGIGVLSITIYFLLIFKGLTDTAKEIHEPIDREISEKRGESISFDEREPFSVLILGVDERTDDKGRSDTMIIITVNPKLKSTKMVSIPRDTYTEIIGKDFKDKINHAYAFGGTEMSLSTVEHFFDIPIDYVVQVNMESFKEIVNAIGGIKIENTLDFKVDNNLFPKGELSLNGEEALAYVRMRYEDPRGDFGRQDRQKQVIHSILSKGASINSLLNYKSIFGAISNNVRTNMTFDEMVDVQKNYRDAIKDIDQLYIEEGEGKLINDIWYYMMDDNEQLEIQSKLKKHLEL